MTQLDEDRIIGCLLGQAIGDALGLPMEGLSRRRGSRLYPHINRHQFFFGRGMGSDDTEHACMVAQSLLRSGGDLERFRRSLAWRLRWWLIGIPAGVGKATLQACVKLWMGWPPNSSGVYSAGNGPAMRAAILGVCLTERQLNEFVIVSTRITHTDPLAVDGALLVADVARSAKNNTAPGHEVLRLMANKLMSKGQNNPLVAYLIRASDALKIHRSVEEFAAEIGLDRGVSGFIAHTVPIALYAFFCHSDDYRTAIQAVIRCGGDTDTVAAITGALVGSRVGKSGIPADWISGYTDWPRSAGWIEQLGRKLAEGLWQKEPQPAVRLAWWAIPVRNLIFFSVLLLHIGRRLLPPY
jgi:ADP-ribosylglycohydrolase